MKTAEYRLNQSRKADFVIKRGSIVVSIWKVLKADGSFCFKLKPERIYKDENGDYIYCQTFYHSHVWTLLEATAEAKAIIDIEMRGQPRPGGESYGA